MKIPAFARRRVAGIPLPSILIAAAVLIALRSVPPSSKKPAAPPTASAPQDVAPSPVSPNGSSQTTPPNSPQPAPSDPKPASSEARRAALKAAIQEILSSLQGDARLESLSPLLAEWIQLDAPAAASWAAALPAGPFRSDAVGELLLHWAAADPEKAAAWLPGSGSLDPESASTLAGKWAISDPAKAASWAASLSNQADRTAARAAIAGSWAARDPLNAAAWAQSLDPSDFPAAATAVADAWSRSAPARAAAWLTSLSPEPNPALEAAAGTVVQHWTEQNPGAVSQWLNAMPESPQKDSAASLFALAAAPVAPTDAMLWASSLADDTLRRDTVAGVCERWYDAAPDEFKAQIPAQLDLLEEPALRHGIYEMLYEKDPEFRLTLLRIADGDIPPPGADSPDVQ
jgi:hypothetical protein